MREEVRRMGGREGGIGEEGREEEVTNHLHPVQELASLEVWLTLRACCLSCSSWTL